MARDLKLQVVLAAIDKATRPIKAIMQGSGKLGQQLKVTRDALKGMQAQQSDIGSFKKLKGATDQTGAAMQANRDKIKQLSAQLAATSAPTKALTADFQRAVRQGQSLKQKHSEQQRELQGLRGKLGAAGISTRNLGQHERDLRQKIASTNQALGQQEGRLKRVTQQQQRLAKAKASYEKSQQLAGTLAASGASALAGGSGVLYAGVKMIAPGVQFDADMSQVQALTRLNKGSEQLAAMRAQSRQLGADTMFSATDAAQGQGYLAMAGFDPQSILDAMPGMLDLAKAGNAELAETSDIASNILTGMNLQARDMTRVGDVLVGAFTRSNTNLQMLGETMKYVAPVASSVGQDIETVAAMAGKLGDAGIQGSMGGTALRAILNRLSAPPKAAAKALAALGISAKDAQGNMRQMPDILTDIYEKTKHMGTADRAGLLKGIAGEEAVSGLQVLVKQAGTGDLQKFIATLRETQGEASKTAKVMGDNLVGDLDELSSAWEDLGIQIQEQQNGPLRETVIMLADVVGAFKDWVAANPKLAGGLVKTAAILAIVVAAGGALTLTLASILGPIALLRLSLTMLGLKGGGLLSTLWQLGKVALPLVGRAIMLVGRAFMLNPIGLAITAIAAGAYLIYRHWDNVAPYFSSLWAEIKQGVSGGIGGIAKTLANFSPLGLIYRAFAGVLSYLGVELPSKFTDFGAMLISGLVNGITGAMGKLKTAITGAGEATVGWFKARLGIHSPSRVFAELGGYTMAGLTQGLAGGEGGVLSQLAAFTKRLAQAGTVALGITAAAPAFADAPPAQQQIAQVLQPATVPAMPELVQSLRYNAPAMPQQQPQALQQQIAQVLQPATVPAMPELVQSLRYNAPAMPRQQPQTLQQQIAQVLQPANAPQLPELVQRVRVVVDLPPALTQLTADTPITFDTRPPLAAAGSAAPQAVASNTYTITINAAPGQDANAIARAVAAELDRRERQQGARSRSSLYDQD